MIDHKPECPMLDEQWPKHPLEICEYCDMITACEKRVLDAAEAAVAELTLTGGWTTPDGVIEEVDKIKAIAAIRALKEKP